MRQICLPLKIFKLTRLAALIWHFREAIFSQCFPTAPDMRLGDFSGRAMTGTIQTKSTLSFPTTSDPRAAGERQSFGSNSDGREFPKMSGLQITSLSAIEPRVVYNAPLGTQ